MKTYVDLHIHSKYARATSKDLNLENLEKNARIKGLGVLGTGDFTHPKWIEEIKSKLTEDGTGILRSAGGFPFILQTEICLVYKQEGKGRRIHHLILAPSLDVVDQVSSFLKSKGRVDYDGRPIFGMSSIELLDRLIEISSDIEIIPAHAWTPWMSIFGSMSGFNSINDCFKEKAHKIHAIETGLSSDPPMNFRLKELDSITLLSNSDCHSHHPWRLGREANIFDLKEITYKNIIGAIRNKTVAGTIEVDPSYGKYHLDGHRACEVALPPKESIKSGNICPKCRRKLTIGVLHRVEELASRPEGIIPENAAPFHKVLPLSEIICMINGSAVSSLKTAKTYSELIERFGNEYSILLEAPEDELSKIVDPKLTGAIMMNRKGLIEVTPGYDGEYGIPLMATKKAVPKPAMMGQTGLELFM